MLVLPTRRKLRLQQSRTGTVHRRTYLRMCYGLHIYLYRGTYYLSSPKLTVLYPTPAARRGKEHSLRTHLAPLARHVNVQDAPSAFGGTKQHVLDKGTDASVESGVRYGSIPGLVADPNDAISLPEVCSTTPLWPHRPTDVGSSWFKLGIICHTTNW